MSDRPTSPPQNATIVMENGRYCTRAGFAGEKYPHVVFPTVFGRGMGIPIDPEAFSREYYVGEDAMQLRGVLRLGFPIECNGTFDEYSVMEKIWAHAFTNELKVDPRSAAIFMVVKPNLPPRTIEQIADIMFNTFEVSKIAFGDQAVLALAALQKKTGCVVDIGESETLVVPIKDGKVITGAMRRVDLAGKDIDKTLEVMLREREFRVTTSAEREIIRDMKEKLCYVALDPKEEGEHITAGKGEEKQYVLPDGEMVRLGAERFMAPEILFEPKIANKEVPPLDDLIWNAIEQAGTKHKAEFLSNILLTGGTTLLPGLKERLLRHLEHRYGNALPINILLPKSHEVFGWVGGSFLRDYGPTDNLYVNKSTFAEMGLDAVEDYSERLAQLVANLQ